MVTAPASSMRPLASSSPSGSRRFTRPAGQGPPPPAIETTPVTTAAGCTSMTTSSTVWPSPMRVLSRATP